MTLLAPALAEAPRCNDQGKFPDSPWRAWSVVAERVEVRASASLLALLGTPRAGWGPVDPARWTPRWIVPRGYVAMARVVQGSTVLRDGAGLPWLLIDLGAGRLGVAPAESRYFYPIENDPPRPDAVGAYQRTLHVFWEVVDSDPAGLNVRLHPRFPRRFDDCSAVWPSTPVRDWPIIGSVPQGTVLQGVTGNLGVIHVTDPDKTAWVMVRFGQGVGFVRWNARFVRPVAGPVEPIRSGR